jgi:hypothetical protein
VTFEVLFFGTGFFVLGAAAGMWFMDDRYAKQATEVELGEISPDLVSVLLPLNVSRREVELVKRTWKLAHDLRHTNEPRPVHD